MRKVALVLSAAGFLATGSAWGHGGDIGLTIRNGRIVSGGVLDVNGQETVNPGLRVFGGELVDQLGVPFGDAPGLFAMADVFPDSELGFDFAGAVQVWDGDKFDPANLSPSTITMTFGPAHATSPIDDMVAPGFSFPVGPDGFDEHYEYTLNPPAEAGVYLLPLTFWSTDQGIGASKTVYAVFNWDFDDSEHDEAIDWVRDNYVPAPGAALVIVLGAAVSRTRRR